MNRYAFTIPGEDEVVIEADSEKDACQKFGRLRGRDVEQDVRLGCIEMRELIGFAHRRRDPLEVP